MPNKHDEDLEFVRETVLFHISLGRDQEHAAALDRLIKHSDAITSWEKLAEACAKSAKGEDDINYFTLLVDFICAEARNPNLETSNSLTRAEERASAIEAAELAERLISLIEKNNNLEIISKVPGRLVPAVLSAAWSRILHACSLSMTEDEYCFSEKVEQQLNDRQRRDYPEFKNMSTSEAYWFASLDGSGLFIASLRLFSQEARKTSEWKTGLKNPRAKNAALQSCALSICERLFFYLGKPHIDIVTGFVSAIFLKPLDQELVKKWWQRREKE